MRWGWDGPRGDPMKVTMLLTGSINRVHLQTHINVGRVQRPDCVFIQTKNTAPHMVLPFNHNVDSGLQKFMAHYTTEFQRQHPLFKLCKNGNEWCWGNCVARKRMKIMISLKRLYGKYEAAAGSRWEFSFGVWKQLAWHCL